MDVVLFVQKSDLDPISKDIIKYRYEEQRIGWSDFDGLIEVTERTFYRRQREALDYIRENWQTSDV